MSQNRPISLTSHLCAAAMGFLGFAISLIIGLWVDNPFETVVLRAVGVLIVAYILGFILAALGVKAIEENFADAMEAVEPDAPEAMEITPDGQPSPADPEPPQPATEAHTQEQPSPAAAAPG